MNVMYGIRYVAFSGLGLVVVVIEVGFTHS